MKANSKSSWRARNMRSSSPGTKSPSVAPVRRRCWSVPAVRISRFLAAVTVTAWVVRAPHAARAADWGVLREQMVREQLRARDITDERVLAAMREVPRHEFVPTAQRVQAYSDHPLPIGGGGGRWP